MAKSTRQQNNVSIPSRGFWFFEDQRCRCRRHFLKREFQSPRGDFGFLKGPSELFANRKEKTGFQSPRGDFGFLKAKAGMLVVTGNHWVSIPSRGFWFFEAAWLRSRGKKFDSFSFNPLAGILVF